MAVSADQSAATPTVYKWAGGREAFERWLNAFYDLVEGDELLARSSATASASHTGATWRRGGAR
jgi:truncated hemoglobin YjbI